MIILLTLDAHACSEGYCSCPVCMYVCMYVHVCMCVHSYLPPHTLESQKRDTHRNTGIVLNFADFPKNASFKSYGIICLPQAALASKSFFPNEVSFYASVKPIATFSLHRQRKRSVEDSV